MKVLITGANGFIAKYIQHNLRGRGHEIVAVCRNGGLADKEYIQSKAIALDFTNALTVEQWKASLNGVDAVINTVGIMGSFETQMVRSAYVTSAISLFKACEELKIKRVIHFSALGTHKQAKTPYYKMRQEVEEYLKELHLNYTILKPSLVYGEGGKSAEYFQGLAALPLQILPEKGEQKVQPVKVEDIADLVSVLLDTDEYAKQEVEVVGPEEVSMKEMLGIYRHHLGLSVVTTYKMPSWLLTVMAKAGDVFRLEWINSDNFTMLAEGNTANPEKFSTILGRAPMSMDQALAEKGTDKADRIRAKTYFLKPLLRITLGLLWIYTALVSLVLYPTELSYVLLAKVGITGALAPVFLYGAAAVDGLIGVLLLCKYKVSLLCNVQVAMIVAYTVIISIFLAEFWLHPFGPVSKNIPLLVAIMLLQALED